MRAYRLELVDKEGKSILDATGNKIFPLTCVKDNGNYNSSALQITFDINIIDQDDFSSGAMVTIYGLPLSFIAQAVNLFGAKVKLFAGFVPGLPLTQGSEIGLIFSGEVWSAYANWEGVNQSLNLIVNPLPYVDINSKPISISLDGKKGQKLGDVLLPALKTAFQDKEIIINISDKLVLSEDWPTVVTSLSDLSMLLSRHTPGMTGDRNYQGVSLIVQRGAIRIFDSYFIGTKRTVKLKDFVGQPTWLGYNYVSFKFVMNPNISVSDVLVIPPDINKGMTSILSVGDGYQFLNKNNAITFTGEYRVMAVRHIGDFRNPSGEAWVTVVEATPFTNLDKT
ncbi:hypothetical protein [Serratia fonticola]|uniref:Uncharacterized protein n=1 Tax=Serratia fonticola TaxID=47917 RepID=A0AAE7EHN9_SERFO|nr:hypothetical protein [Serratia fonticola]QKJ58797.1 hypothetical protein G9399_11015 [Serratia fonticola]